MGQSVPKKSYEKFKDAAIIYAEVRKDRKRNKEIQYNISNMKVCDIVCINNTCVCVYVHYKQLVVANSFRQKLLNRFINIIQTHRDVNIRQTHRLLLIAIKNRS